VELPLNRRTIGRRPTLAILIAITMVGQVALNIILPSLAGLTRTFDASYATVTLTLTLFLVGMAVAQLAYGVLSDRYGRRPIVLGGLVVFNIGTLVCLASPTIEVLIFGRVVQAVGGCAGMVMGRAMVRDIYDADRAAAMIAYLTMAVVVAPTLAPLIGGYLNVWYGWRASFVFVLIVGLLTTGLALAWAHETLPAARHRDIKFFGMFRAFAALLRNPLFNGYAFQVGFNTAAYFAFLSGSPRVLIDFMGGSPEQLGVYFVAVSMLYIGGNFGTARLSRRFGAANMVTTGTLIALSGALALVLVEISVGLSPLSFFGLMSVIGLGNGFCISAGMAGAISADPSRIGAASGLAGSMQLGFSAVATYLVGLMLVDTALPLVGLMLACSVLAVAFPMLGRYLASAQK
jgi:DHA1 family bicyclomycin/chloramphenicol resistance-like MFS transporter